MAKIVKKQPAVARKTEKARTKAAAGVVGSKTAPRLTKKEKATTQSTFESGQPTRRHSSAKGAGATAEAAAPAALDRTQAALVALTSKLPPAEKQMIEGMVNELIRDHRSLEETSPARFAAGLALKISEQLGRGVSGSPQLTELFHQLVKQGKLVFAHNHAAQAALDHNLTVAEAHKFNANQDPELNLLRTAASAAVGAAVDWGSRTLSSLSGRSAEDHFASAAASMTEPTIPGEGASEGEMIRYQSAMQKYSRMMDMYSKLIQAAHDMKKGIIANFRV